MYDLGEIIGRYVLTGVILWFALIVMLVIRLIYVGSKPENGGLMTFLNEFEPSAEKGEEVKTTVGDILCYILWPYGLIHAVHIYMKRESKTIERTRKLQEERP